MSKMTQYDTPAKNPKEVEAVLDMALEAGLNVLLTGMPGCGKTSRVLTWCKAQGLKTKYFNGPTLDPYTELSGVPDVTVVTKEIKGEVKSAKVLQKVAPAFWQTVEVLVIDEVNRANRETRNALLELALFHTINGKPVPNLKMIIGMRNPDNTDAQFDVEVMDKAILERLQIQISVPQFADADYMVDTWSEVFAADSIRKAVGVYNNFPLEVRCNVSPRMFEDAFKVAQVNKSPEMLKYLLGDNAQITKVITALRLAGEEAPDTAPDPTAFLTPAESRLFDTIATMRNSNEAMSILQDQDFAIANAVIAAINSIPAMASRFPGLKEFVEFFVSDDMAGPDGPLAAYGLVSDPELAATQAAVAAETPMGPLN
jgi:DNA replication protein DnaC